MELFCLALDGGDGVRDQQGGQDADDGDDDQQFDQRETL